MRSRMGRTPKQVPNVPKVPKLAGRASPVIMFGFKLPQRTSPWPRRASRQPIDSLPDPGEARDHSRRIEKNQAKRDQVGSRRDQTCSRS